MSRIIARSEPDDEPGKAPFGHLGTLGPRAAKYLRNVHLVIASLPTESDDAEAMTKLANIVDSTIALLLPEDHGVDEKGRENQDVSLHLHTSHPSPEYRDIDRSHPSRRCHQLAALQADVNPATGAMKIGLRNDHTVLRKVDWP